MVQHNLRVIARREFAERATRPAYWITTLLGILVVIAMIVGPGLVTQLSHPAVKLGSVSVPRARLQAIYQKVPHQGSLTITKEASVRHANRQVRSGNLPGYFVTRGSRLTFVGSPNSEVDALIAAIDRQSLLSHISSQTFREVSHAETVSQVILVPMSPSSSMRIRTLSIYVLGIVLFMLVLMYGSLIGMSVVEEKETRHAEVLLARITPQSLLAGKITGFGLLAFLQLAIWGVAVGVTYVLHAHHGLPGQSLSPGDLLLFLLWALIGFAQYAIIFAALASRASRTSEMNQATMPISLLVMIGYMGSILAAGHPSGILATILHVLGFIPYVAPLLGFALLQLGGLPTWELILDIVLQVAVVVASLRIASQIFRRHLLNFKGLARRSRGLFRRDKRGMVGPR